MIFQGNGYVRFNNKTYEFVDGILEVTDSNMIEKMKEYYEHEEDTTVVEIETVVEESIDYNAMTNAELKRILDCKGIQYSNRASKSELIELLGVD